MSIQNDKLLNLAGAKALYDDLRARIDIFPEIATTTETEAIINEYGDEEDEGMVFTAHYVDEDNIFVTDATVSTIEAAYKAGKNVVIHFVADENSSTWGIANDIYATIVAMKDNATDANKILLTCDIGSLLITGSYVDGTSGKLCFYILTD